MDALKIIAQEAVTKIQGMVGDTTHHDAIFDAVEAAVIKGMLEGQHRAVDAAIQCPEADEDLAHKIATEIRRKNDALIANLSSLR